MANVDLTVPNTTTSIELDWTQAFNGVAVSPTDPSYGQVAAALSDGTLGKLELPNTTWFFSPNGTVGTEVVTGTSTSTDSTKPVLTGTFTITITGQEPNELLPSVGTITPPLA
jgi:hypothetical protein